MKTSSWGARLRKRFLELGLEDPSTPENLMLELAAEALAKVVENRPEAILEPNQPKHIEKGKEKRKAQLLKPLTEVVKLIQMLESQEKQHQNGKKKMRKEGNVRKAGD
jgi:hypothetical protein